MVAHKGLVVRRAFEPHLLRLITENAFALNTGLIVGLVNFRESKRI